MTKEQVADVVMLEDNMEPAESPYISESHEQLVLAAKEILKGAKNLNLKLIIGGNRKFNTAFEQVLEELKS